jgi:hypothetical protein
MTDTSKYPHQSMAWILFIVFALLFLPGAHYYFQGAACHNDAILNPHWGSTVSVPLCGDDEDVGILLLAASILPISALCLIPTKRVKCPKCGYKFGDDL